jgi:hypothetical protein
MTFGNSAVRKWLLGVALVSSACGGNTNSGQGGGSGNGNGVGNGTGSSNGNGVSNGGAPSNPNATVGPKFNGAGIGFRPLTPGCGPDTAGQCTGTCEQHASTGTPTGIIRAPATLCFGSTEDPTPENPMATIEQVIETINGQRVIHLRVTFDPAFVDNTYGANACCGWPGTGGVGGTSTSATGGAGGAGTMMPGKMPGMMMPGKAGKSGHTFDDLVGSDHVELLLTDGMGKTVMDFKVDYITADSSSACGYHTLGVSGGEGKMIQGDASAVLKVATSLDRNLNGCGYCYTTDSPATDEKYTPNASAPAWDYRVVYEVWLALDTFGSAGFGQAYITNVHASPSKLANNTVEVEATPCPPDWDTPTGGSCPPNFTLYVQSEGVSACVPIPFSNYPGMAACPQGYQLDPSTEGRYCIPTK